MTSLAGLDQELRRIGGEYSGTWTYALTDLSSGESIGKDADAVMPAASLIKVPILIALYQAVADGRLSLSDRTKFDEQHRFGGSGVLQRMTNGVEMTVRDAATLMIIISDNAATNMCVDLVGIDSINELQRRLGMEQTTVFRRWSADLVNLDARQMWVSTAAELARNLELIARHEAVSQDASEDMLRILRRQDYRHELSRLLPWNEMNMLPDHKQNWVAEKGGSSPGGIRTGGSIFHGERGYFVLACFCEGGVGEGGTGREAEGNELLGEIGYAAWQALAALQ